MFQTATRVDNCHRGRCRYPHEPFTDQQNETRDQRQQGNRNGHFICLHEQWSSTLLGLRGFGAQHQGEKYRFLRTWETARRSPKAVLARHERFLRDITFTVL
jgi:hypothetical protein